MFCKKKFGGTKINSVFPEFVVEFLFLIFVIIFYVFFKMLFFIVDYLYLFYKLENPYADQQPSAIFASCNCLNIL